MTMNRDSQEGAEGRVSGNACSDMPPAGADNREVGPDEAPTVSKAAAPLQEAPAAPIERALAVVKAAGYVVLKEKSYRQTQERQRVAECLRRAEAENAESARRWARDCLDQERMLRERVTYLAALCMKLGATMDQLRGEDEDAQQASYLDFLKPIARYDHSIGRWVPIDQEATDG